MAAAVTWSVAAWLLLDTAVPDGLRLPDVEVDTTFGSAVVRAGERYERFVRWSWLLSQIALLATLWLYARKGAGFARESAAGRIGTGMLLGMLGLGIVWLVQLPFGLADHWWERRHDLTDAGYLEWALSDWAELAAGFGFICLALLIVMALAGPLGGWWWLPGSAVFVGLALAFVFVLPYLTPGLEPLRNSSLAANAREYEREQGLGHVPIRIEEVSQETDVANAYAFGIGTSRRVVLWDTLLRDFPDDEVRVVVAHELAHHSSDHIPKGIAWYALFAVPGAWIVALATRRRGGMRAPEAVPLGLLVVVALQLAATPVENWIGRRMESEADWKALVSTEDPAAAASLFRGFADTSLADPSPPGWAHLLLDTHPTLRQRVAMARAWARSGTGAREAEAPP